MLSICSFLSYWRGLKYAIDLFLFVLLERYKICYQSVLFGLLERYKICYQSVRFCPTGEV